MANWASLMGRICVAAACTSMVLGLAGPALAQASGASGDITRGLTDPKNGGVAGTGMGSADKSSKSPASGVGSGGATGTGMSVKGPPGQGISGPETGGMDAGQNGAGGTGSSGGNPSPKTPGP